MRIREIAAPLATLVLAACVTAAPPPPEAVLQFTPAAPCASALSAAKAVSLTPETPAGTTLRAAAVGGPEAQCYSGADNVARPYALFAVPDGQVASVNAGAMLEGRRVLAAQVSTLDAELNVMRTFARQDFQHRGRTYSVLFRPIAGERYILVTTDAAAIGGRVSFVTGDPDTAPLPPHLGAAPRDKTFRAELSAPFSYEGTAFARVYFNAPTPP